MRDPRPRRLDAMHAAGVLAAIVAPACSGDPGMGSSTNGDTTAPPACPEGQVVGPNAVCMTAGIQGCAAPFIDEDRLCRPATAKCAGGTIPRLDAGCAPVGIPSCAAAFVDQDGLCRPAPETCGADEIAVPSAGCVPLDGPEGCGDGTWGAIAAAPGDVYVDPSAAGDTGDGSRARPLATIAAAIAAAPSGGRVVLAAGAYDEPVVLRKELTLRGRCAKLVTIRGTTTPYRSPVIALVEGADATLEGMRLSGDGIGILVVDAVVEVRGVAIIGALSHGVHVEKTSVAPTSLTMTRSAIRGTRGESGRAGIQAYAFRGELRLDGVELRDGQIGVSVDKDADVEITDSVIQGSVSLNPSADQGGIGVYATSGKTVVERSAVLGHRGSSFRFENVEARLELRESLVDGPRASVGGIDKVGVRAQRGARAQIVSVAFTGSTQAHVAVVDGGEATVSGSLLRGPAEIDEPRFAYGALVDYGRMTMDASAIVGALDTGVAVRGSSASFEGTGVILEGTVGRAASLAAGIATGMGVVASAGEVRFTSSYIAGNHVNGAYASGDVALELTESLVEGPPPTTQLDSTSLWVGDSGARLRITSTVLRRGRGVGVFASGCGLEMANTWVDDIAPNRFEQVSPQITFEGIADGILATGSQLDLRAVLATRCDRVGALFDDSEGMLAGSELRDNRFGLVSSGARQVTCAEDSAVHHNTEQDRVTDGVLPVPNRPVRVP